MFGLIPFGRHDNSIWNYFDNMEKEFLTNFKSGEMQFRTDIIDQGGSFQLRAELPGFSKEEITISAENELLTITAQHKEESEEKKENYIRRERRTGTYSRQFDVSSIEAKEITANYENGVLLLNLPKKTAAPLPPAQQIEIQ